MKIITFGTLKGGVGKTTICFNIGGMLSLEGRRVLIIDSDLQGNLTNNIGLDRTRPGLPTIYDIYNAGTAPIQAQNIIIQAPNPHLPSLDLIAGSLFMHRAELEISSISGKERILASYMEHNANVFNSYDYILIDTNPSMSIINQNAFLVSDSIILIGDVSMNSIEGAQLFIALWDDARSRLHVDDNIHGFVINDFDIRNRISTDLIEYLDQAPELDDIRKLLFKTIIPRTVRITESELASIPICLYDPQSKACKALVALTDEMKIHKIL